MEDVDPDGDFMLTLWKAVSPTPGSLPVVIIFAGARFATDSTTAAAAVSILERSCGQWLPAHLSEHAQ